MNKNLTKNELREAILSKKLPSHLAIIMDGNGRWANKKGMPRTYGHQKGAKVLAEITKECQALGIDYLTVFAFSTENWTRPKDEIDYLFNEAKKFRLDHKDEFKKLNIKVNIIGEKDYLDNEMLTMIKEVNETIRENNTLTLNIAFNYGSHQELVNACQHIAMDVKTNKLRVSDINDKVFNSYLYTKDIPPVDLLIRTSGEMRISNFLLWQIAYSELYFTNTYWPDFHVKELYIAINDFQNRQRRFGGLGK